MATAMPDIPVHPALTRQRPEEMSRGLRWSLLFHATVFVIIVFKALVFPGEPIAFIPALRVDIVGLPDILKKDLSKIPKTPAPDVAKPAETEKPTPPRPPVKAKAPPPKEMAEPDEMVLKPTQQQEKVREKRMKSALDRIKALEKINDEVKSDSKKAAAMLVKGNKVSKGTSLSPDAREAAEASYFDSVRDTLQSNWALPVWLARQRLDAQILIRIDSSGRVSNLTFMKPSGNAQFDAAVRKTVQDSQPFPPPPPAIADSVSSHGILVGFPL